MKIPFFLSLFIIFLVFFNIKIKKSNRDAEDSKKKFLEKERQSMFVRKKSLENLDYINISLEGLPLINEKELSTYAQKQAYHYQEMALQLILKPMLDLSSTSNTDLKLQYGPANLEALISYEQNYLLLLKTMLNWGKFLSEANKIEDSIKVLEKGIEIGSDLSQNYILLSELYHKTHQKHKLIQLKEVAYKNFSQNVIFKKVIQHIDNILE